MRLLSFQRVWSITFVLLVLLAPTLVGQTSPTGAISGVVTDSTGAVTPSAKVTATKHPLTYGRYEPKTGESR
jgi:hypothetical protein